MFLENHEAGVFEGGFAVNSSFLSIIWRVVGMYHTSKHNFTSVLVLKPPMKLLFQGGSLLSYLIVPVLLLAV